MTDTPLNEEEIAARLSGSRWQAEGHAMIREYVLEDFAAVIAAVNRIGAVAEELGHHPDILIHGWNRLALTLSTHSVGGLTEADFTLAARIDALL